MKPTHAALALSLLLAACSGDDDDDTTPQPDASPDEDSGVDAAPDPEPDASVAPDAGPVPLPEEADDERLAELLRTLAAPAMQGRLTGSAGGDLAEQTIVDTFESAGIEVETQDVTFPLFEVASPVELSVVDEDGVVTEAFAYVDDFREVDFAGSGAVTGELVFAGYGIVDGDYDSYAGLDVTGQIVALLTGVPNDADVDDADGRLDVKLDVAHQHGAAGVVFILTGDDGARDREAPLEMELWATDETLSVDPDRLHEDLPAVFVHVAATERLMDRTASNLVRTPDSTPVGKRVRLELHGTTTLDAECRNVFGVIEGTGDEVVILGAHYDHLGVGADGRIFHGAGDNASGTAVVMESAIALARADAEPVRTIVFALFCAEEQGLWGSLEYTYYGTPLVPLDDTRLMVQVDYLGEQDGPYLTNYDGEDEILDFVGTSMDDDELPLLPMNWGGQCASDDCAFLMATDVPAYRFIAYGQHHHQATDTFENLNLDMVGRVADICIRGLIAVAYE